MTVSEELARLGIRQGAAFNQGSFRVGVGVAPSTQHRLGKNTVEGADITGGYCAGVALDWCRRVLLSGPDRSETSLSYGGQHYKYPTVPSGGIMSRKEATVRRMAKGYAEQAATYVGQTNMESVQPLLARLLATQEIDIEGLPRGVPVSKSELGLLRKVWKIPDKQVDLGYEPAATVTHAQIRGFIADKDDSQHRARDAGGRSWSNMAATLDERFNQIRVAEGRQVSSKPFSGMKVRSSYPTRNFDRASQWAYVLDNEGYEQDCCTLISISPGGGGSGHAVAVHQKTPVSFDFFDPNFGTYRMTKENLGFCFQHLFWTPYFEAPEGTLDGDKAIYQRRDSPDASPDSPWTKMGYTIFERA